MGKLFLNPDGLMAYTVADQVPAGCIEVDSDGLPITPDPAPAESTADESNERT